MSKKITNIAHRGASSYAPENTKAAFDLAIEMGVKHIELDVHSSKDNHLVVIHDDTLDRTTNGQGNVKDFTLKELQSLDAGSWFSEKYSNENICTLEEIISKYAESTHLHIEIKGRTLNLAQKTCTLIRSLEATDMVTITSFWKDSLVETKNFAPEMKTGWLVPMGPGSKWDNEMVDISKKYKFDQICPRAELVTKTLVSNLHREGFEVRCHGVFTEDLMRSVVSSGADGMTFNIPDKLNTYLNQKGIEVD